MRAHSLKVYYSVFIECDFSCESSCSGPGNKACDSCADGYYQSEDGGCLGMDRMHLSSIKLPVTFQIKMNVLKLLLHYVRKQPTVKIFLVVISVKVVE